MQEGFSSAVICQSNGGDNAMVGREADDSNLCWAWRTKRDGRYQPEVDSGTRWLRCLAWLRWVRWLGGYLSWGGVRIRRLRRLRQVR